MPPTPLTALTDARNALATLQARDQALTAELLGAMAKRDVLLRTGVRTTQLRTTDQQIATLKSELETTRVRTREASAALAALRAAFLANRDPDTMVATLAGTHPVAMLPVRLETRFFNNGAELRIRIYPDQIHLDHHDPALTPDEQAAAAWYWAQRTQGGANLDPAKGAWAELVRRFGAQRAAWIVEAGEPGKTPGARASRWSRASTAAALPDRWLVVGYRAGQVQFRKWGKPVPDRVTVSLTPDPAATDGAATPPPADLPLAANLKWLADYPTAEAEGMAITVRQADVSPGQPALATGVDRLVVLGVDWTLDPNQGATAVHQLLVNHLYADGLSVVPRGTPTNNTQNMTAGKDLADSAALDPLVAATTPTPTSLALARLFGIPDSAAMRRIPGGGGREQETAQRILSAIWSSTLGYYLNRMMAPLMDAATQVSVRDHALNHLHPNGYGPTLRIGKQPYGILSILPRKGFVGSGEFETKLGRLLDEARQPWSLVLDRVPRAVAGPGTDGPNATIETRMRRILQQAPVASSLRYRRILSPTTAANGSLPNELKDVQERLMLLLLSHFGWGKRPYLASLIAEPKDYPLPAPFVQAAAPGAAPLAPNYIKEIADLARSAQARAALQQRLTTLQKGDTLLQSFLALSAIQAIDAGTLTILASIDQSKIDAVKLGYFPVSETVRMTNLAEPPPGSVVVSSPGEAAQVIKPEWDPNRTVSNLVSLAMKDDTLRRRLPGTSLTPLQTLLADLDYLAGRNADELDWSFRGVLDCMSYRLDAWISSLANRRLGDVRSRATSTSGTYIGGYGWVENLKPDPPGTDSLGYVFAPSLPHAAAAAILRSGYQAHADGGQSALDIDLSSARVDRALRVLDGVASGQPLAALLGYRLERGLRTRDIRLARFILPIRRVAPLRSVRPNTAGAAGPVEAVAARDVCDGVALVDRLRSNRAALLAEIRTAATPAPQDAAEIAGLIPGVEKELDALSELMDSISDVLVTESVYQTVVGNHERAGAALGVLDRQMRPIQPQAVETPRSGHSYTQRAAVVTLERLPQPAGTPASTDPVLSAWAPASGDARAAAEPRLNAWVARLLGQPKRYRFAADLVTRADDGTETRQALTPVTLDKLGLSPLMLVAAAGTGAGGQPSELHRRLVAKFLEGQPALAEDTAIELKPGAARGGSADSRGLGALESMLELIRKLLGSIRSLDNRDFLRPAAQPTTAITVGDLRTRSVDLVNRIRTLSAPLANSLSARPRSPAAVFKALSGLSDAGITGALPAVLSVTGLPADAEPVLRLLDQARDVSAALAGGFRRIDALDQAWTARADKPASAEVDYHTERIRELLGKDFPIVTPFQVTNAVEIGTSLADQASLTNADPLVIPNWLQRLALVRPPLDRLASVITAADLLGTLPDNAGLSVAQLPHAPGSRWLALPQAGAKLSADLALVIQSFAPPKLTAQDQTLAGFICDDWSEVIPSAQETVAATFHYDAPGARPPQVILVATPPSMALPSWTTDTLLDVVNEAFDLARLRMIGPEQVDFHGLLLPAIYLPDGFNKDVPGINLTKYKDYVLKQTPMTTTGKQRVWNLS